MAFTETVTTYDENYVPVPERLLEIRHSNTPISFSPAFNGFGGITALPVRGLELNWIFKGVSRQFLDNTGRADRSLPAYWYSNLRLAYAIQLGPLRELRFSFWINNVFNRLYSSNGYTFSERYMDGGEPTEVVSYRYYYPQAGIQFYGGISALF
jgi:iron complex outermembrane receptor protein